jgi:hypothetical protein
MQLQSTGTQFQDHAMSGEITLWRGCDSAFVWHRLVMPIFHVLSRRNCRRLLVSQSYTLLIL